jgi:glycopeptide antibiotics resistance protein
MTESAQKSQAPGTLTLVLFVIYAALLVAVILFKFPFQYQLTGAGRQLNLIPFAGASIDGRGTGIGEDIENVFIFVPFGIYLSMLKNRWSFGKKALVIAATSVAFETIQFVFGIGRADVTDVLCNTLGGVIGIALYFMSVNVLRSRTNRVLNIVAIVITVLVTAFFAFLRMHSK